MAGPAAPRIRLNFCDQAARLTAAASFALAEATRPLAPAAFDALQGRTGPRCRRLVHALAGFLPGARFLEISADSGAAAALSALHAGGVEATVIDGGWRDPAGLVARNREAASVAARDLIVLLGDFRMGRGVDLGVFDVLVYGGAPDPAEFQDAMDVYLPSLADAHVLVVENWNHHPMRSGFSDFLERSGARVAYAAEIRTTMDNSITSEPDPGGWGGGCYVAVVEKASGGAQGLHSDVEQQDNLARLDLVDARLGRDAAAVARPVSSPPVEDVEDADLHRLAAAACREFESLGTDCEFGLVQRQLGIEQISLLRWAGLTHASLMQGLVDGFVTLLENDAIIPELHGQPGTREYLIFHKTAKIMYHTFRYEDRCDAVELLASQKRYLAYLRLKFLEDLTNGEKLYVWKSSEPAGLEKAKWLLQTLRSYGPNRLLWVCEADTPRQAGRVEALSEHLLRGYVDRFSVADVSFGSWFRVCATAGLLWSRMRSPSPVIEENGVAPSVIDVAFIADDAYTEPLHAAIRSTVEASRSSLRVHVVSVQTEAVAGRTRALLRALRVEHRFIDRQDVRVHLASRPCLSDPFHRHPHAIKLLLDELLPDLGRVLYLDADLIVRRDLGPLWTTDLTGRVLAAVEDASFMGDGHEEFRELHEGRYFNAGVMLIDLAAWRAADIGSRFGDWHRAFDRDDGPPWVAFWEQSPLNMAVAGRWKRVSPCWNFWPSFIARNGGERHGLSPSAFAAAVGVSVEELWQAEDDPAVCHFAGPNKPWLKLYEWDDTPSYVAYREHSRHAERLIGDAPPAPARAPEPQGAGLLHGLLGLSGWLHARLTALRSPVRLLQVGAHNGRDHDPYHALLRSNRWHGVLIEPVAHLFADLQASYAGCRGVSLRQVAASRSDGRAVMRAVKRVEPSPSCWFSHISSLEREPFALHAEMMPGLDALMEDVEVETRTLDSLVAEHDFLPDVVSISAEGHEAKILSGFDLRRWRPLVVRMHVQHLSETDRTSVAFRLKRAGYVAARDQTHLLAFLPELLTAAESRAVIGDAAGVTFL